MPTSMSTARIMERDLFIVVFAFVMTLIPFMPFIL